MGILDSQSKAILVESMRNSICGALMESTDMSAADASARMKYVRENATYEQLLNITMNPDRETNYLPDHVLEGAVAILHSACLTGRKYIGQNAIAEGAMKLQKATGCVITESMLDAALNAVEHGSGLKIVGSILKESAKIQKENAKKTPVTEGVKEVVKQVANAIKKGSGYSDIKGGVKNLKYAKDAKKAAKAAINTVTDKQYFEKNAKDVTKKALKQLGIGAAKAGAVTAAGVGTKKALDSKKKGKKKSVKESATKEPDQKTVVKESIAGAVVDNAVYTIPFMKTRVLNQIKLAIKLTEEAKDVSSIAKALDEMYYKIKWFRRTGLRSQSREVQMACDKNNSFWKRFFSVKHRIAYELEKANGDVEVAKHNILAQLKILVVAVSVIAPGSAVASWLMKKPTKGGMDN